MTAAAAGRAARAAAAAGVDALLVTDLVNIRYLTGFTGSNAALLVHVDGDAQSRLCTDGRYRAQVAAEVPDLETVIERACAADPRRAGRRARDRRARLRVRPGHRRRPRGAGGGDGGAAVLVRAPGLVQQLRMVKDDGRARGAAHRVRGRRRGAGRADRATAGSRPAAPKPRSRWTWSTACGRTARRARRSRRSSRRARTRPCRTTARPRPRCARGDFVKIDFGALVDGYHSDMTRTVVLGRRGGLAARAVRAGRRRAGGGPGRAHRRAPTWPTSTRPPAASSSTRGAASEFVHPLGHGVGLQIHEAPLLGATGSGRLAAGMAVTVEPGVYLEGAAACGSRTRSSSPTARPRCSPGSPRICWRSDRAILEGGRRRAPQISARAAHPGACSPRATDERRSHTPWPPRTTSRTDWC